MARRAKPVLFHELKSTGQHRIVSISDDGSKVGEWAESHELAVLDSNYANADTNSVLPVGIFRVQRITAQALGG